MSFARKPSDLSIEILKKRYLTIKNTMINVTKMSKKILSKANARLQYTKIIYSNLKEKYKQLDKSAEYNINYKNHLNQWEKYDNKASLNGPSNWFTMDSNINLRKYALMQGSKIESFTGKYASFYMLKYGSYSDFTLNLDVMIRSDKPCGIVFRALDIYNFYAIEINQKLGVKRFIRSENGIYKVLHQIHDGGLTQNQWFKLQIRAKMDKLSISIGDSNSYAKYSSLPKIFVLDDSLFRQGAIGLFTNGNDKFYVDRIRVKPIKCWTPWVANKKAIKVINSRANIFSESYKGDVSLRYKHIDPKNSERGPGEWIVKRNYYNRDATINQVSEIRDKSPDRDHTIYVLKDKFLKEGTFSVDFLSEKSGIVGIVFKFVDTNNYLMFEIGGFNKDMRFFQIRKKLSGMKKVVKRINEQKEVESDIFGFSQFIWYRVKIIINKERYRIFISKPGQKEFLIFDEIDKDINYGYVGISTCYTIAGFDNLVLKPKVEETKTTFISDDDSKLEDDIFQYDNQKKKEIQNLVKNEKSRFYHRYKQCLKIRTPDERNFWCNHNFSSNHFLKQKCQSNYCNVCCEKIVPSTMKMDLFHCKKNCSSLSLSSNSRATEKSWYNLCIVSPVPERSLYSYCEQNFGNIISRQNCKIDGCRMCCVNSDNIFKIDISMKSLNLCFSKCAKEFTAFKPSDL